MTVASIPHQRSDGSQLTALLVASVVLLAYALMIFAVSQFPET